MTSPPPTDTSRDRAADGKLIIIARRCGRLANRIVLSANFIGFAMEHGHRLVNFPFHSYAALFQATRGDLYCGYPQASRPSRLDAVPGLGQALRGTRLLSHAVRAASLLNETIPVCGATVATLREDRTRPITWLESPEVQERIRQARIVFAYGWNFRAPASVRRHADAIRDYFRPIEPHEQASREVVDRLGCEADIVVGVHIRRTDYQTWKQGRYFYPVSRYAAWMREVAEQFPGRKVAFLICADEPRSAEEFPGLTVGFGTGFAVSDLFALAKCDYLLGPPSTFSQWASFHGNTPLFHCCEANAKVELDKFRVSFLDEIPGRVPPKAV